MNASYHQQEGGFISTGVRLPSDVLRMLRHAALERAEREGGRVSVSATLTDLVRRALAGDRAQ